MMLGVSDGSSLKRAAHIDLTQHGDDELTQLMAAWQILQQSESVVNSHKELANLALLLGRSKETARHHLLQHCQRPCSPHLA